ncbi:MAG: hypothetical protein KA802_17070 [Saprospiraceae bacterium]|jgi:hypothetical protein|nr:hypothetical protein [Saprospiraceae bacterium]
MNKKFPYFLIMLLISASCKIFNLKIEIGKFRQYFCGGCIPSWKDCNEDESYIQTLNQTGHFQYARVLYNSFGIESIFGGTF